MFRSIHFNGQRISESSQHTQQFCFQRVSGNHLESWGETRKKRDTKRRKEDESIYEVTTSADKTESEHDDVYEVIKTNDTEYIDNEDDRVVMGHEKRKSIFNKFNGENTWRHSDRILRNKYYLTGARPDNERNPG